ncbi:N-acetyltransferase [Nocardia neocaledoniensis NBRC 108232]|uniref:Acetyltransferase (GNAT) family protein n=1 Tax=Nocardia neocaledoniensis TaxID=236511 RepID=A0A317NXQ0_9NOCA|nr:GNAT family N-acetyltransferase [Nocardia neocaledoniensis]PWV78944.1 acetyltransferase (GNAT) family protein [Nocardia neocaledoniensis]GEM35300.1 N-acetyltransferase [Nocardia neocaledoniensis NBRC 108232]
MPVSIRPLSTADLDRAAQILGAAFADYPWTNWCVAEDAHLERVSALQRLYLEHIALPHGRAYIDSTRNGVLALLPPDAPAPAAEVSARIAELHGDRLDRLMAAEERMSTLPVPDGAWLLATIGTTPQSRGTGLGTALMNHGMADLDRAGHPCWLDTSTERNLPLYQRFGFTIADHLTYDGVPVWRMHRRGR